MRSAAATLQVLPAPGGIHQNSPHQFRADRKEMRAILPTGLPEIDQAQVDLIH
jgi:hypothetical protein